MYNVPRLNESTRQLDDLSYDLSLLTTVYWPFSLVTWLFFTNSFNPDLLTLTLNLNPSHVGSGQAGSHSSQFLSWVFFVGEGKRHGSLSCLDQPVCLSGIYLWLCNGLTDWSWCIINSSRQWCHSATAARVCRDKNQPEGCRISHYRPVIVRPISVDSRSFILVLCFLS